MFHLQQLTVALAQKWLCLNPQGSKMLSLEAISDEENLWLRRR
jgi:hypothetical protein